MSKQFEVATVIKEQIGHHVLMRIGNRQLLAIGSSDFQGVSKFGDFGPLCYAGLRLKPNFGKRQWFCEIVLEDDDTYTVYWYKWNPGKMRSTKLMEESRGVYWEMLPSMIDEQYTEIVNDKLDGFIPF